ncbi:MAG: alpha-L-fucosidase [Dysgonamonadaceae bacterium]|jgi:alpha-L-fucosidase|nr:alpha-L-fucosidase [Dysgonamonadaceae bacterium]
MKTLVFAIMLALSMPVFSQTSYTPTKENLETRKWFEEARFGMFIHFGPYAVLGNGEWVMNNRNIKVNDYQRLIKFFNPKDFDAAQWVAVAKSAGMKYITLTSRHHDSFSNWDTKQSDWKITKTPYGKDIVKQLAAECQKQGIKLFFYYSTLDWARDDYRWKTGRTGQETGRTKQGDWNNYIAFMKAQLTELLTGYGPVGGIWFDGHWDQTAHENRTDQTTTVDWHYDEIYSLIHKLQPACLIANNHHLPPFPGEDFQIFERDLPGENKAGLSGQAVSEKLPLETCETMNGSWGYSITDNKYKTNKELIDYLVRAAGYGTNLLLNVGPMPNGEIQPEFVNSLAEMGKWTSKYGYTIYGASGGFIKPQSWGCITQKDNKYYIHLLKNESQTLTLDFPVAIKSATWIDNNTKVNWKQDANNKVTFILDGPMNVLDAIIEVTAKI